MWIDASRKLHISHSIGSENVCLNHRETSGRLQTINKTQPTGDVPALVEIGGSPAANQTGFAETTNNRRTNEKLSKSAETKHTKRRKSAATGSAGRVADGGVGGRVAG